MTHAEFGLFPSLAKRTPEGRIEEQRIVAEAVAAARFFQDHTFHPPAKHAHWFAAFDQRDGAHKRRRAPLHAAQFFEQQPVVRLAGGPGAGIAGGAHSRRAIERVHHQSGVVREKQPGAMPPIMPRFDQRVFLEGGAVFDRDRDGGETGQQLDFDRRQARYGFSRKAKFRELARVGSSAEELDQIRTAFFCSSTSSAMPRRASVRNSPICASSKEPCSAVA